MARRSLTVTYRAEHVELGRLATVKRLKPSIGSGSAFSGMLEREAKVLSRLQHESIVTLYELVRGPEGVGLVLEPLEGHPLSEVLAASGRLEPLVAVAIAVALARALAHAHARGVVHRELRADVVLVSAAGGVKVVELGTAQVARLPSLPEPLEGAEALASSEGFAPEQLRGEPAGPPADVYALGALLYRMLAGRAALESSVAGRRGDRRAPAPLRGLVPSVAPSLERVVMRCLAAEPLERYPSGDGLARALEKELAARPHPPERVLVSRALAAAGLAEELAAPEDAVEPAPDERPSRPLRRAVRDLAAIGLLIVAAGVGFEQVRRAADGPREDAPPLEQGSPPGATAGYIKVLARPWAEVFVDGQLIDVTPIGRPIAVAPGKRHVTFRHPSAPDERRVVEVAKGQTVLLEVTMRVERRAPDAGAARPVEEEGP